jgi:hypothetical protein
MDNLRVGLGLSLKKDYLLALGEALQQAQKNLGQETADLAIVISSPDFSHSGTLNRIKNALGPASLIGASSRVIISPQGIVKQGILLLLLRFSLEASANVASVQGIKDKGGMPAGEELGERLLRGFKGTRKDFGLVLTDAAAKENAGLIAGLQEKLGLSFPLIGVNLLATLDSLSSSLYFEEELLKDAAAAILLGGRLSFGIGVKHGWKPLGKPRLVTKSEDNTVYEINNKSATNLYEEYFASNLAKLKKDTRRIAVFYPIGILLPGTREYLLRSIVSFEDNGALIFHGNVPETSTVRLMIATKESCLEATREAALEAKNNLAAKEVKFVLVFSAVSRYNLLARAREEELKIIQEVFGKNIPLAGMLSYGEQAPLWSIDYRGKAYFLNHSVIILAIGG